MFKPTVRKVMVNNELSKALVHLVNKLWLIANSLKNVFIQNYITEVLGCSLQTLLPVPIPARNGNNSAIQTPNSCVDTCAKHILLT